MTYPEYANVGKMESLRSLVTRKTTAISVTSVMKLHQSMLGYMANPPLLRTRACFFF